ncbi:glycosyltransferase family A protein [Brevundimonas sp. NIBR11]|uniref:glycosyltransferase family 2 protein n=1 Tax=Brevundimonas sp. NIBR11 TaxID=3015999 RepID=UPI0022F11339|nr:glycosyltransferase family A protein [Brevundimonas sp. NIBR11]WGM31830.1 hypothetical protein KKHFBJBL_02079 [Brevundimonas sp. NIBR11]
MLISVLVPTYRRPDDLARCLAGLERQTRRADEVVVVHREDDLETRTVLSRFAKTLPVVAAAVSGPGAVRAYNLGLDTAAGDLVAITDDDAIPHTDWLARIETHFAANETLGAVGGRDVVHEDGVAIAASRSVVGRIQWFGRVIGNHHLGRDGPRPVHVLKGVNMSFRRAAITGRRFDARLRGAGAQVHLEIGLCTAVLKAGWGVVYDPEVRVDHFPARRHDDDQRTGFSAGAQVDAVHNETLALLDYLPWARRGLFVLWATIVGTRQSPGAALALLTANRREGRDRFAATMKGRAQGIGTWLRTR